MIGRYLQRSGGRAVLTTTTTKTHTYSHSHSYTHRKEGILHSERCACSYTSTHAADRKIEVERDLARTLTDINTGRALTI